MASSSSSSLDRTRVLVVNSSRDAFTLIPSDYDVTFVTSVEEALSSLTMQNKWFDFVIFAVNSPNSSDLTAIGDLCDTGIPVFLLLDEQSVTVVKCAKRALDVFDEPNHLSEMKEAVDRTKPPVPEKKVVWSEELLWPMKNLVVTRPHYDCEGYGYGRRDTFNQTTGFQPFSIGTKLTRRRRRRKVTQTQTCFEDDFCSESPDRRTVSDQTYINRLIFSSNL